MILAEAFKGCRNIKFDFISPILLISANVHFLLQSNSKESRGLLPCAEDDVFAALTNLNIICLMFVSMKIMYMNTVPTIIIFSLLTIICLGILFGFINNVSKTVKYTN